MTATAATAGWPASAFSTRGGVDVLPVGHDHVLEPVDDEQVAVVVQVAAVAGSFLSVSAVAQAVWWSRSLVRVSLPRFRCSASATA
jgi:hypothetical protein